MKSKALRRLSVPFFVLAACLSPLPTTPFAGEVTVVQEANVAICEYSAAADRLVLEYHVTFGELAGSDTVPRLRVYGNGRVHVHNPPYMKKAGDYELWLSDQEMNGLISSLAEKGVLDFDEGRVRAAKKERIESRQHQEAQAGKEIRFTHTADGDVTIMGIFLDRCVPQDRSLPRGPLARRISWRNLKADARKHPDIPAIVRLAAAAEELSRLADDEDLEHLGN